MKRSAPYNSSRAHTSLERPKVTKQKHRVKLRQLSMIESFPVEILEHIFSYTVNPNFPRSSLIIGRKLSSQMIYERQCRRVFCFFKGMDSVPPHYSDTRVVTVEDKAQMAEAQTETLKCQWMTFGLFDKIRKELIEREISSRKGSVIVQTTTARLSTIRAAMAGRVKIPGSSYQPRLNVPPLELWLGRNCQIPSRLIQWPLSESDRKFLDALTMAGCEIDWSNSLDGEKALEVWKQAVSSKNYEMVHRFMSFGIQVCPTDDDLQAALDTVDWDIPMIKLIQFAIESRPVVSEFHIDFPETYIKVMARYPPRTLEGEEFDKPMWHMISIWQGAPRWWGDTSYPQNPVFSPKSLNPPCTPSLVRALGKWYSPEEWHAMSRPGNHNGGE